MHKTYIQNHTFIEHIHIQSITKQIFTNGSVKSKPRNHLSESKTFKKVQVGKDQENAQSERDSHSKNRGGKKPN